MVESSITKADVRDGREALNKIREALELIKIGKACGLDCSEDEQICQNLQGFLTQFLEMFGMKFPTR